MSNAPAPDLIPSPPLTAEQRQLLRESMYFLARTMEGMESRHQQTNFPMLNSFLLEQSEKCRTLGNLFLPQPLTPTP